MMPPAAKVPAEEVGLELTPEQQAERDQAFKLRKTRERLEELFGDPEHVNGRFVALVVSAERGLFLQGSGGYSTLNRESLAVLYALSQPRGN